MDYKVYHMTNVLESDLSASTVKSEAFICFNTHEDRSFNAFQSFTERSKISDVMILSFMSDYSNLPLYFHVHDIQVINFSLEKDLNCDMIPCLKAINEYIKGKEVINIDISCMPVPFLAQILHFLFEYHSDKPIKIYYTEPSHYTLHSLFDYSAFGGEITLETIKGFEGETSQFGNIKRVLFYLMGFEKEYLDRLIPQEVPPDEIAPINGFPSYFPKYKDISLINEGTDFREEDIEIIYAESNNPFDVYNAITALEDKFKDCHIDIIPAGTKPMALGACLYALKNVNNTRCRVIFPIPSDYKPKQSHGCGKMWEYCL